MKANEKLIINCDTAISIGDIGNQYGDLSIDTENGKYYWCIDGYGSNDLLQEIPKYLYDSLLKYENERIKK